jgi:FixJ family two-component response regulator
VFRLLAAGKSNRQIAAGLFVAETTVKTHVARILTPERDRPRLGRHGRDDGL